MFRTFMSGRTRRAIAAGALIFSLAATTFVGTANAAPLANNQACSAASQARKDAAHALRDGWKASVSDLKTLASDAHGLRKELFAAWRDLKTVLMQAVQDLKDLGIGGACDEDATTPTDTTALAQQAKEIVDKAILDLQAIVDAARTAAADQATATNDDEDEAAEQDEDANDNDRDQDEDVDEVNDKDKDNDDHDANENVKNRAKLSSTDRSEGKSMTLGTVRIKSNGNHGGHRRERD